jgi:hypothetical protein
MPSKSAKPVPVAKTPRDPQAPSTQSVRESAKPVAKTPREPQAPTRSGRERRPSDKLATNRMFIIYPFFLTLKCKIILIVSEQHEADLLKAQKAERRALREKKAFQKANQQADLPSDGEGVYEPRQTPTVIFCRIFIIFTYSLISQFSSREVVNKPSQITRALGHRSGKVPPAPTTTSQSSHFSQV